MTEKKKAGSTERREKKHSKAKTSQKKREDQLREKLKEAKAEIETLKERFLRTAAELDNFRKRTEREILQIVQNANRELIKDILPIIDDLERSLNASEKKGGGREFIKGIELIYGKLMSTLHSCGLERMESVNEVFDVEKHEALLQIERDDTPSGIVVEEHEKGYLLNGKVLRHAKVVVSK